MKINHQDENVVIIYERNGRLYVGFNSNENKKKTQENIFKIKKGTSFITRNT